MTPQEPRDEGQPTILETGEFYCSTCKSRRSYDLKTSRPQAPAWLSRIFGDGDRGRYVECRTCGSTAVPAVLQVADPSADADYLRGIRRVAVQMMAVDGSIEDEEVSAIKEMYKQVTGHELEGDAIREEAGEVSADSVDELAEFLSDLSQGMSDKGKELILKTAFWVVSADSAFDESEASFIYRVGGALGVSAADVRVLMDRMS